MGRDGAFRCSPANRPRWRWPRGPCASIRGTTGRPNYRIRVPADPTGISAGPSRPQLGLQAPNSLFAPGGPRADRSDTSTSSVAGGHTIARSLITPPHAGHAAPNTPNVLHNSAAYPARRDRPHGRLVSRPALTKSRGRDRDLSAALDNPEIGVKLDYTRLDQTDGTWRHGHAWGNLREFSCP